MKSILTLLSIMLCTIGAQAVTTSQAWQVQLNGAPELTVLAQNAQGFSAEAFLDLTPKQVREITGERLGVKGTLALKAAQKAVKKSMKADSATDLSKGIYVLLAIIGLGWLAMGLLDEFNGNNWWIGLLLGLLCWLPGVIFSLVKMKDYY